MKKIYSVYCEDIYELVVDVNTEYNYNGEPYMSTSTNDVPVMTIINRFKTEEEALMYIETTLKEDIYKDRVISIIPSYLSDENFENYFGSSK